MAQGYTLDASTTSHTGIKRLSAEVSLLCVGTFDGATVSLAAEGDYSALTLASFTANGSAALLMDKDLSYSVSISGGGGSEDVTIFIGGTTLL